MAEKDTKSKDNKFDVAVIGAGPAGMMAAGQAAKLGDKVILIEKNKQFGKKILLTGNGRCNITNAEFNLRKLTQNYGKNGNFLFHAFSVFGPKETIEFFNKLGLKTKTEKNGRVFPESNNANDVLGALNKFLTKNKVNIVFNSEVAEIVCTAKKVKKIILKDGEITAKKYILCTGGKSYPLTGSDGFGYKLAEKMGHTIIKPIPALSPIIAKEEWAKSLPGISLEDTKISVFQNGKKQFEEHGEVLFTHFGVSGPEILNISGGIGELLEKGEVKIYIDLFPLLNHEELLKGLEDVLKSNANKTAKNILSIFVPERFAEALLDNSGIDKNKIANNMSTIEKRTIVKTLKNIEITAQETLGFDKALVTRGGISLKEIDHKTMKSKIIDNLYFAGEIIDIDGKTGGFNLQSSWSTGYLAGKGAADID
jgi:predicted Rossmann fold flavoprotein